MTDHTTKHNPMIDSMFKAGAHYGLARSRRHPSVRNYVFGVKNRVEIFDLEKTQELLTKAREFTKAIAATGKQILFVGAKNESRDAVKKAALAAGLPYVAGRWIGGTLTNFPEIKKRIDKLETLVSQREKGELAKYTKKERLLIDREIENLERYFRGIVIMKDKPAALFIIDPKREKNAIAEARQMGVPVIALASSDCNIKDIEYPVVGNDSSVSSITFFANEIASAYKSGKVTTK